MRDCTYTLRQRIYALDIIKFLAAVLIVFHHYQYIRNFTFSNGINFYGGKIYVGFLVELFFMISGILCEERIKQSSRLSINIFLKDKIFRIYPMAMASISFYAIVSYFYRIFFFFFYRGESIGIWKLLTSEFLVFSAGAVNLNESGINNPTWYLSVLMICYVVYGIILKIAQRTEIQSAYFCIAMLFGGVGILDYSINLPFANEEAARGYVSFFGGVILFRINEKYSEKIKKKIKFFRVGLMISLVLLFGFSRGSLIDNQRYILIFVIYPLLLTWIMNSETLNGLLQNQIVENLGALSYEMYLWHVPVMLALSVVFSLAGIHIQYNAITMVVFTIGIIFLSIPLCNIEKRITYGLRQLM